RCAIPAGVGSASPPAEPPHNPPPAELPAGLSRLAHPAARRTRPLPAGSWGTVFPGLPPDGVGWPGRAGRAPLLEPACGYREPQRAGQPSRRGFLRGCGAWSPPLLVLAIRVGW